MGCQSGGSAVLYGKVPRALFGGLLAFVLAVSLVSFAPPVAQGEVPSSTSREERIQALLQGDYAEGRVLVSVADRVASGAGSHSRGLSEGAALLSSAQDILEVAADEDAAPAQNSRAPFSLEGETSSETIKLVQSSTLSTEELIRALIDEPGVTTVEPDYLWQMEDSPATPLTEAEYAELTVASEAARTAAGATNHPDFTPLQWAYQQDGSASMHIPGWDENVGQNMSQDVYVAVFDSGVDYTHPDLAGAFEPLPSAGAVGVQGGDYGIDLVDDDDDPIDNENGHGTHCAGVIAGTWGNGGVSGAASRAKLVAVRIGSEQGYSLSAAVAGYAYLKELIGQGVAVRVANHSWGGGADSTVMQKSVAELGRRGVVSVLAAGNDGKDVVADGMICSSYFADPYSITVGSSNELGSASRWSSYSSRAVDLYAPGANIFSTYPTALGGYVGDKESAVYREGFEGKGDGDFGEVTFASDEPDALVPLLSDEMYRGSGESGHSVALAASAIAPPSNPSYAYLRLMLPRRAVVGATAGSMQVAFDGTNAGINIVAIFHVDGKMYDTEGLDVLPSSADRPLWTELAAVFPAIDDGRADSMVEVEIIMNSDDGAPLDGALYLDDLSFGGVDAQVPYVYMSGTSMSAPAIAGATAVLMAQEGYDGGTAEDAALAAATIAGSVEQVETYGDLCISSGTFDFSRTKDPVPVVRTIALNGENLSIDGYFFGDERGSVTLVPEGGQPVDVTGNIHSWSDGAIELTGVEVPAGMVSVVVSAPRPSGDFGQAFGRQTRLLVEGADRYETDLTSTLPQDEEFAWHAGGTLTGLGDTLYRVLYGERHLNYYLGEQLWAFDTKAHIWSALPLPEALSGVRCDSVQSSAYRGRLLVRCVAGAGEEVVQALWSFDPVTGKWEEMSLPSEVSASASMAVLGDEIVFVGGVAVDEAGAKRATESILAYDPETGAVTLRARLDSARADPVVCSDGTVLLVSYGKDYYDQNQEFDVLDIELLTAGDTATTVVPAEAAAEGGSFDVTYDIWLLDWALAREGAVMLGSAPDGKPDTFMRPYATERFEDYPLRCAPVRMSAASAIAYEGQLYVLGFSPTANQGRLFRATAMDTRHNPNTDLREQPLDAPEIGVAAAGSKPTVLAATGDAMPLSAALLAVMGALAALGVAGVRLARAVR